MKIELTSKELSLEGLEEDIVSEDQEKQLYTYEGPVYVDGHLVVGDYTTQTLAVSSKKAFANILWKARNAFDSNRVELVPECIYLEEDEIEEEPQQDQATCPKCGRLLNTSGECPLCDLNDESVLDEQTTADENEAPELQENLYQLLLSKKNKGK